MFSSIDPASQSGQGTGITCTKRKTRCCSSIQALGWVSWVRGDQAGTTLYIPQGTWHGVEAAPNSNFWVVSPPHFAETLRESAKASDAGKVPADLDEVGRKHGYRDSRHWLLPQDLLRIAATLATWRRIHPALESCSTLSRGGVLRPGRRALLTIVTLLALAMGSLSSIVIALSALLIAVAIFIATLGGIGVRAWRVAWRAAQADLRSGEDVSRQVLWIGCPLNATNDDGH